MGRKFWWNDGRFWSALQAKGAGTSPAFTAALFLAANNPNNRLWFNWLMLVFSKK